MCFYFNQSSFTALPDSLDIAKSIYNKPVLERNSSEVDSIVEMELQMEFSSKVDKAKAMLEKRRQACNAKAVRRGKKVIKEARII